MWIPNRKTFQEGGGCSKTSVRWWLSHVDSHLFRPCASAPWQILPGLPRTTRKATTQSICYRNCLLLIPELLLVFCSGDHSAAPGAPDSRCSELACWGQFGTEDNTLFGLSTSHKKVLGLSPGSSAFYLASSNCAFWKADVDDSSFAGPCQPCRIEFWAPDTWTR